MIRSLPLAEFLEHPRASYLIKGLLPRHGLGVVFGEPGSGKSFFSLDLAAAIARGIDWRGHRTKQSGAIYVCAEGLAGLGDRLRAYCVAHSVDTELLRLEVITSPINLLNPDDAFFDELVTAIRDASERIGAIGLIVIDTLARVMPGGDENAAESMTALVANATRLADAVGAFVALVHHAGKDLSRGARGHSSLKAAVDLEIEVIRTDGGNLATITKARDFESGAKFGFRLESIDLGLDDDGDTITSCVIVPADAVTPRSAKVRPLSGVGQVALQALREVITEHGESMPETSTIPRGVRAVHLEIWRDRFALRYGEDHKKDETVRKAFHRGKESLLKTGCVAISAPYCWETRP